MSGLVKSRRTVRPTVSFVLASIVSRLLAPALGAVHLSVWGATMIRLPPDGLKPLSLASGAT